MSFLINPYAFLAAGGDFESIATVTVGSGGASSIEFTSIPGTYQHLQVRLTGRSTNATTGEESIYVHLGNGSFDTGSNYAWHVMWGDGSAAQAMGFSAQAQGLGGWVSRNGNTANVHGGAVIDILDYASTSKTTTMRSIAGYDANGSGRAAVHSSMWTSTSAVERIKLFIIAPNSWAQYSTAALYGVKA